MRVALTAFFTLFLVSNVYAQQIRYVSDVLYVPLRSGKGNEYRIIDRGLRSGTRLTVIEQDSEGEWSFVETEKGVRGWIRNQYIQAEPIAQLKLTAAERRLNEANSNSSTLRSQLNELRTRSDNLTKDLSSARQKEKQLTAELDHIKSISASAIDLNGRHQALMKQHQLLQTELDVLKAENARLNSDASRTWFMYGAGAVGLGVLIAIIVPIVKPRRRSSDWA